MFKSVGVINGLRCMWSGWKKVLVRFDRKACVSLYAQRSSCSQVQLVRIKGIKTHSRFVTISATEQPTTIAFRKKLNNFVVIQIRKANFLLHTYSHTLVKQMMIMMMMSKFNTKSFVHMNDSLSTRESKQMGAKERAVVHRPIQCNYQLNKKIHFALKLAASS